MNVDRHSIMGVSQLTCVGLALFLASWSQSAFAQGVDEFGPYGRREDEKYYESPQHWAVELRFGPYYPQVDQEFNGPTPLADTLGNSKRLMVGIEGDWQALRVPKILSFGPGFGTGYTAMSKSAMFAAAPDGTAPPADVTVGGAASPMDSTLKIWLQWVDAVVRIDALNRNFHIPLVFTAKLGLGQALWWAGKGNLAGRDPNTGTIGHGRSWGPTWALGIMFDLNFMQPERARKLDAISDINHMYLFAEWYQLKLNGFGSGNQLQVGDSTWALGFALEF